MNSIVFLRISSGRIIEWLLVALLLVTLWPICSRGEDGQLTAFHGGDYCSQLLLSNSLLSGLGSRTASLGGTCSGLEYGPEDLYWNPGRLGFANRPGAMVDLIPPLVSLDANLFLDIDDLTARAVDDLVDEMGSNDLVLDPGDYPNIQATVGQKGMIHSAGLTCPVNGWVMGTGFHRPLSLEMEVKGSGLKASFSESSEEELEEAMIVSTSADLSFLMDVQVNAVTFALGRNLSSCWSLGLSADRYYGSASARGRLQTEGLVTVAGHESAFNDPDAEWPDDLYSELSGSYNGAAWGWKAGVSCRLRKNLSLDGTITLPATLRLNGRLDMVQYELPGGIDLDADPILNSDEVDLDESTRTQLEESPTADQVVIDLPGSVNLGAAWKVSFVTSILQYSHYLGDFSGSCQIEDAGETVTYHLGIEPSDAITLGIDLGGYVRLSGGLLAGWSFYRQEPEKKDAGAEEKKILVPIFNLGTRLCLGSGYGIDLLLISVPSGQMRATTTLEF